MQIAAAPLASDRDFCEVGFTFEILEFFSIDDETRRGLAVVLSLKDRIHSLRETQPKKAAILKKDLMAIAYWVDDRLQKSALSVEEVAFARWVSGAKASSAVRLSGDLMRNYERRV